MLINLIVLIKLSREHIVCSIPQPRQLRRISELLGDQNEPRMLLWEVRDKFALILDVSCPFILVLNAHGDASLAALNLVALLNPKSETSGPFKIVTDLFLLRLDGHSRYTTSICRHGLGTRVVEIGREKVILKAGHGKTELKY